MKNKENIESKKIVGMDVTVQQFLNRLEKCMDGKDAGKKALKSSYPFFIRVHDSDLDLDIAQTGWSLFPYRNIPLLIIPKVDELCPSNITNVRSISELVADINTTVKIQGESFLKRLVMITAETNPAEEIKDLCFLSDLFGQGGIHFGCGKVDLDNFGLPTENQNEVIAKKGEYYIMEPVSVKYPWTFGEIFTNGIFKVVLTGSPKYRTKYYTKDEWLKAHNQYVEVSSLKDADILFTESLNSTTEKMKKARQLGIEIREYTND